MTLEKNAQYFGFAAWQGVQKVGRGAVVVFHPSVQDNTISETLPDHAKGDRTSLIYVPQAELRTAHYGMVMKRGSGFAYDWLKRSDPENQVLEVGMSAPGLAGTVILQSHKQVI